MDIFTHRREWKILIFYYRISLCLQAKQHNFFTFQQKYVPECVPTFVHIYTHACMCITISPKCCIKIIILHSNTGKRPVIYCLFYILPHIQFNSSSINFVGRNSTVPAPVPIFYIEYCLYCKKEKFNITK